MQLQGWFQLSGWLSKVGPCLGLLIYFFGIMRYLCSSSWVLLNFVISTSWSLFDYVSFSFPCPVCPGLIFVLHNVSLPVPIIIRVLSFCLPLFPVSVLSLVLVTSYFILTVPRLVWITLSFVSPVLSVRFCSAEFPGVFTLPTIPSCVYIICFQFFVVSTQMCVNGCLLSLKSVLIFWYYITILKIKCCPYIHIFILIL